MSRLNAIGRASMKLSRHALRYAAILALGLGLPAAVAAKTGARRSIALLNVSYDPTRELWRDLNRHFIPRFERETGTQLSIRQSHGGSSTQSRAVIDGLEADVVTLASIIDTDAISKRGLIQ